MSCDTILNRIPNQNPNPNPNANPNPNTQVGTSPTYHNPPDVSSPSHTHTHTHTHLHARTHITRASTTHGLTQTLGNPCPDEMPYMEEFVSSKLFFCYGVKGCGQSGCGPVCSYKQGKVPAPTGGHWGFTQAACYPTTTTTTTTPAATTTNTTTLNKYLLTFRATGCPATGNYLGHQKEEQPDKPTTEEWWATQANAVVWEDMYWYCISNEEWRNKVCCGESYPCVVEDCEKQQDWTATTTTTTSTTPSTTTTIGA